LLQRICQSALRGIALRNFAVIWWGVSVEDQKYGVPRIADLQKARASVRFLSVEPLLEDLGKVNLQGIGWVIVGGESGPGARPLKKEWVLSVRDQCQLARIPFFFKQWGGVRKSEAGRELDGQTYNEFPGRIQNPVLPPGKCSSLADSVELPFKKLVLVEYLV